MVEIIITAGVMKQPKYHETLFDLDKAIAMHLENERKYLAQIENAAMVKAAKRATALDNTHGSVSMNQLNLLNAIAGY